MKKCDTQNYFRKFIDCTLKVDTNGDTFLYKDALIAVGSNTTSNFFKDENFAIFECVCHLLKKGYKAGDLELEPRRKLGHEQKSEYADILITKTLSSGEKELLVIIECKAFREKFDEKLKN